MPRFRLTLEYAGTRYSGWQIQTNARTVQGELQRAIRTVTGQATFELSGSGRTDAGVHALAQVAHLDVATTLPPVVLRDRANDLLPADITVLAVETVSHRFHARHDAVARRYLYRIARRKMAFGKAYVWWIREPLDLAAMREAAARLTGMHDFRSFSDADAREQSTKVLLERVQVEPEGDLVLVRVEGSHFIWKLVRRLVGVLAAVGRGDLSASDVERFLREPSPIPARLTAPASGLFLEGVFYPGEPRVAGPLPAPRIHPPG
jgi:tRNA pseudouridine38-40 synthase